MLFRSGWTPEEAGRNARYQKFNEVCEEFHYHKIAVAHNQNDQAETVIHQMSRGCRLSGLTAMEPKTGRVIRPLLTCSRLEIENYLSEKKYNFMNDSTNVGNDYTRNRIRHHVLPLLEEEVHQGATKHIASMALELQELEQFLQKEIVKIYTKFATVTETSISFQIDHLNSLDSYLLKEVLRYAFVQLCGQRKDITSSHIEAMSAIIDSSGTKEIYLPYQVKVHKNYETYFLIQENKCLNKQENHKLIKDTFLTEISNVRQMIIIK